MSGIWDIITGLFSSRSIRIVPFYSLRHSLAQWREYQKYPGYYELPPAISFPSEFWNRITEIHRHTLGDKHERAISVWWADGEFVLTENVRGGERRVQIPRQYVSVSYKPVKGTRRAERFINVNEKIYARKTIDIEMVKRIKKIEVQHLFNMHTHPPHEGPATGTSAGENGKSEYLFFSLTDLQSLVSSAAALTGLVTDKLWILFKTESTPSVLPELSEAGLDAGVLTQQLNVKVYCAEFGKAAVVIRPPEESI